MGGGTSPPAAATGRVRPGRRRYQTNKDVEDAVAAEQKLRVEARTQAMAHARAQVRNALSCIACLLGRALRVCNLYCD
jgi:hypothetical protein